MEEEFAVRVRAGPPPAARLLPSERRYSASTALGQALVHLALALLAALLVAAFWQPLPSAPSAESAGPAPLRFAPHISALLASSATLAFAAFLPGAVGLLAWRRWYEDRNIHWLLMASIVSAVGALLSLVTTSAALAIAQEHWSTLRLDPAPGKPASVTNNPHHVSWPTFETDDNRESARSDPSPAYETPVEEVVNTTPQQNSDPSTHEFMFPGLHYPVDPVEDNGTFQDIWMYTSVESGIQHQIVPEEETKEMKSSVTSTTSDPMNMTSQISDTPHTQLDTHYEQSHRLEHTEHPEQDKTSEDYETDTSENYPTWQHEKTASTIQTSSQVTLLSLDRNEETPSKHISSEHELSDYDSSYYESQEYELPLRKSPSEPPVRTSVNASPIHGSSNYESQEYEATGHKSPVHGSPVHNSPDQESPEVSVKEVLSSLHGASTSQDNKEFQHHHEHHQQRRRRREGARRPLRPPAIFWDSREAMSFLLSLNLIVASMSELAWSLWTIMFAWRGTRSDYPEDEEHRPQSPSPQPLATSPATAVLAPSAPKHAAAFAAAAAAVAAAPQVGPNLRRPDIISNHQQKDPILQETTMPYEERVQRFLASEVSTNAETRIE